MEILESVDNLKNGDVITMVETAPIWDGKKNDFKMVEFTHKFEIVRNNKKTYGCKYIEGAFAGSSFNWIKGADLTKSQKKYYI